MCSDTYIHTADRCCYMLLINHLSGKNAIQIHCFYLFRPLWIQGPTRTHFTGYDRQDKISILDCFLVFCLIMSALLLTPWCQISFAFCIMEICLADEIGPFSLCFGGLCQRNHLLLQKRPWNKLPFIFLMSADSHFLKKTEIMFPWQSIVGAKNDLNQ